MAYDRPEIGPSSDAYGWGHSESGELLHPWLYMTFMVMFGLIIAGLIVAMFVVSWQMSSLIVAFVVLSAAIARVLLRFIN